MLDILRANARSALTYVLFGIIILVFVVSFGPGSCGGPDSRGRGAGADPTTDAAKVNGETISAAEFDQHYAQLYRVYQQQAGEAFSRDLAERLGLRRVALDQLVERTLLRQEALRRGVVVGDDDLERAIKENPAFQAGGRFDHDYYVRAVTGAYGSPARFEERMREDLAVQKMIALLRQTAKVSDEEVREAWLSEGDRANLEFVRFPLAAARQEAKVGPAEAAALARASPDRVKKHYEENKARWDKPKRVRARHILVKVEEGAPADQAEAARKRVEEIAARAKKGEDFAALAKATSEDGGTKDQGGELGWFGPGVMAKPFEEAAFGAKAGDVVGPVQTRFGLHVIRVEEVQEPQVASLDAVAPEVAREVLEADRAGELARRRAQEALAAVRRSGKPLSELFPADEKGKKPVRLGAEVVRAEETGPVTQGSAAAAVPRLGPAPELVKAAFAADRPQLLDRVFDTAAGPVVARVKERVRPDPAQFEAAKAGLADRLRARREAQLEQAWVKALREQGSVTVNEQIAGGPGLASSGR